jgi:hypothetical protein
MTAHRYLLVVTLLALVSAVLAAAFNRVVDPFWYYRDVSLDGFNAIKPKFKNYERHVKPALVRREQPASLIFGSSFAEAGFDPLHPALAAPGKSYNFALAGAQWDMVSCHVQFALVYDAALRQIVLGIHPDAMPQKDCGAEISRMAHPEERAFLFSLDAFEASINTVLEQRHDKPSHTADGLYFHTRGLPGTATRFREVFAIRTPCDIGRVDAQGGTAQPASRERSALDLGGLRDIVRKAAAGGIALKLVVYPRHALSFEQEYQCGTRKSRWDALAQIVALAEQEGGDMVQVWDFEGYHEIGTEPVSEAPGRYWQDPTHFNYEFGNVMLDEMFGMKAIEFGQRLTSAHLRERAARERKARAAYLQGHPELLHQLTSLLPRYAD